jgi:hypothetical protein
MKVKKREEFIQAMKETAIEYINGKHRYDYTVCKLCKVAEAQGHSEKCNICPWMIITGKKCNTIEDKNNLIRAKELLDWVKIYEESDNRNEFIPFSVELKLDTFEMAEFWYSVCGNSNRTKSPGSDHIYYTIDSELREQGFKEGKDYSSIRSVCPFDGSRNYWELYKKEKEK